MSKMHASVRAWVRTTLGQKLIWNSKVEVEVIGLARNECPLRWVGGHMKRHTKFQERMCCRRPVIAPMRKLAL